MSIFTTLDISSAFNAPRRPDPSPWHERIGDDIAGLPEGQQAFWGVPFILGSADSPRSWVQLHNNTVSIPVAGDRPVTFLVFAHFCDASFDPARPGIIPGTVINPGEKLADYALIYEDGSEVVQPIRRRFEISEATAWGQLPFAARSCVKDIAVNHNGPYPRRQWGKYQLGVIQGSDMPGARALWLYALANPHPQRQLSAVRLAPTGAACCAVLGLTLFHGSDNPLHHRRLESLRISGDAARQATDIGASIDADDIDVDMGVVARTYLVPAFDAASWLSEDSPGRGSPETATEAPDLIADVSANLDATLSVGERAIPLRPLYEEGRAASADGAVRIELLSAQKTWLHVSVEDSATGRPAPVRVRFCSPDGRYCPPYGHPYQVNANFFEEYGADLKLGTTDYAYVDGDFQIELPVGDVYVELFKGFEYTPLRQRLTILPGQRQLKLNIGRQYDWRSRGWVTADTHVHFISPQTAWLEGQAEGVNVINLLATQLGDLFTNVGDVTGKVSGVSEGDTIVYVGTENRHHILGHISLLGVHGAPVYPMTAGGPSESYIGDPTWAGLSQWAAAARERDGVVILPHFPNPNGEATAALVRGQVDGVELKYFGPLMDNYGVTEWYRFLNCGYRIAAVGGTDKMSAAIPVGGVRTYARLDDELSFGAWTRAVRAGRTFTTSGPLIDLLVEGKQPGEQIDLPAGGGVVEVEAWAESIYPFHQLEIVCNGRVVAAESAPPGTRRLRLKAKVNLAGSGWIAARCVSPLKVYHTWVVNVAAHSSPVYLVARGQEQFSPSDATYMLTLLEGGLTWLDTLAIEASPEEHAAVRRSFLDAQAILHSRLAAHGHTHH